LLNITGSKLILAEIVNEMPFLVWIHSITAGVDHILCPEIVDNNDILLTNAKGASYKPIYYVTSPFHVHGLIA